MKNLEWFKKEFIFYLKGFEIKYKFYERGDFGSLDQVEFNSYKQGGEIDFWSTGCLGIHFVDYEKGVELMNVLLMPNQEVEKEIAFQQLKELLEFFSREK